MRRLAILKSDLRLDIVEISRIVRRMSSGRQFGVADDKCKESFHSIGAFANELGIDALNVSKLRARQRELDQYKQVTKKS